jgi:hypothetical protein
MLTNILLCDNKLIKICRLYNTIKMNDIFTNNRNILKRAGIDLRMAKTKNSN